MASFADDMNRFKTRLVFKTKAAYVGTASRIHASIKGNSSGTPDPVTGAAGQPVGQYGPGYNEGKVGGELKASWVIAIGEREAVISTNKAYAEVIETGIGPYGPITQRSTMGGFHSVQQTIAGASALQADVVRGLA